MWLLTSFAFFHFYYFHFANHTNSSTFLPGNVSTCGSAVFAKHWHVPTEGPINKNLCHRATTNIWRFNVVPALGIYSRIQNFSETSKGPLLYIFVGDKSFDISQWYFSAFWFCTKFCLKKLPRQIEFCFKNFAENVLPEEPKNFAQLKRRTISFFSI